MIRLQITLSAREAEILAEIAASEFRDPRDQMRVIIRKEFERLGLLDPQKDQSGTIIRETEVQNAFR